MFKKKIILVLTTFLFIMPLITGQNKNIINPIEKLTISNSKIELNIFIKNKQLEKEIIKTKQKWIKNYNNIPLIIESDGDYSVTFMWAGWRAPGKVNNADNPVAFSKKDFLFEKAETKESNSTKNLTLYFELKQREHIKLKLVYKLGNKDFYIKRKIAVMDKKYDTHLVHKFNPLKIGLKKQSFNIQKKGGFGQPIVIKNNNTGAFFGLEYPASRNTIKNYSQDTFLIKCSQIMGEKFNQRWKPSDWAVIGLCPENSVKLWFFDYLKDLRVTKIKPYTLYNSWYDLRAADYPSKKPLPDKFVMNEKNIFHILELIKTNFIDEYNIKFDAIVLDDGWDVYESDWVLRKKQFPNGLAPISEKVKNIGADLGIWFGPTGGYSARKKRINWMKSHDYEVIGEEESYNRAQMCVGGEKYSALLKKRVVDFVKKYDVGYYKLDGFQFSCNEPEHGHPIGIYSRRAIMEKLFDICKVVRTENPDIFLNITSGTWLSPWWVKYANQIWMQGGDYGYANVPSISERDSAMTYRDFVLYDDFKDKDLWFPIANLMTHGIIKGNLQKLGGEKEPLDKFTNNALLYFARGISMYELYISPDILNKNEWKAIAQSLKWGKSNFEILSNNTTMIGENLGKKKLYGFVHYLKNSGIIAARNPYIKKQYLNVKLSPSQGLDKNSKSLVVERIYPSRYIYPKLYSAGENLNISLQGYETAVFEIYPLEKAKYPLVSDTVFNLEKKEEKTYNIKIFKSGKVSKILNPKIIKNKTQIEILNEKIKTLKSVKTNLQGKIIKQKNNIYLIKSIIPENYTDVKLAILFESSTSTSTEKNKKQLPELEILEQNDLKIDSTNQKNIWKWSTYTLNRENSSVAVKIKNPEQWEGDISVWIIGTHQKKPVNAELTIKNNIQDKILPPLPHPEGIFKNIIKIGNI